LFLALLLPLSAFAFATLEIQHFERFWLWLTMLTTRTDEAYTVWFWRLSFSGLEFSRFGCHTVLGLGMEFLGSGSVGVPKYPCCLNIEAKHLNRSFVGHAPSIPKVMRWLSQEDTREQAENDNLRTCGTLGLLEDIRDFRA
jgi:hypothetical protein